MKKKNIIIIVSVIVGVVFLIFPVSTLQSPLITPSQLLSTKPYVSIGSLIIIVPSSTLIVYALGVYTIWIGYQLSKLEKIYQKYWGFALILWGIGTFLAGTSYQGFGYMLKCSGQAYCLFTSAFELSYLYITALSITVMAYAVGKSSLNKKYLSKYFTVTQIGFLIYTLLLVLGTIVEIHLFITYEWFLVFFLPYFISFFVISVMNNRKTKNMLDQNLIRIWMIMLLVNVIYFIYLFSGIPEMLYENSNLWFSANDVLHIGLIYWMYFIYKTIKEDLSIKNLIK